MDVIYIILTSLGSIVALFILTKIMGNRQMSELSMFDYVNGITIGSIAAEMATSLEGDFWQPLVAMIVYTLVSVLISVLTCKSIKLRKILTGRPLILYENNKIYKKNLKKSKLDISEMLTQCRTAGYFDLANIDTIIMESSGKLSIIPVSDQRPVNPKDLNIAPSQEKIVSNVIEDGIILRTNLKLIGKDEIWLRKELNKLGVKNEKDVFLATCDNNNKLNVYKQVNEKKDTDPFN